MKKFFYVALIAIMGLVATACTDDKQDSSSSNEAQQGITLTSEGVINAEAKSKSYQIRYTTTGSGTVEASTDNPQMIDAINSNTSGYIRFRVTDNPTSEVREAQIFITYGTHSVRVKVVQAASDNPAQKLVSVAANQLAGTYYGDDIADGVGHYYIILSKDGFDANGQRVIGGEYFRVDFFAPLAAEEGEVSIPDGKYTFDSSMTSYTAFTIKNLGNTDYLWINSDGEEWAYNFIDATLTVSGNHLELKAATELAEYHVTFDGDYTISRAAKITDWISSLDSDTVIDVSNCKATCTYFKDSWNCGCPNWQIEFVCRDGFSYGTYLVIDFLTESTTDFTGTFVASGFTVEDPTKPDFRPGVFVPGFRLSDSANQMMGSLFVVNKDGVCIEQAPLSEGTVTITSLGGGQYNIVIDAYDDAPVKNKLTLNWTGAL